MRLNLVLASILLLAALPARAKLPDRQQEAVRLATTNGSAERQGDRLILHVRNGRPVTLLDRNECAPPTVVPANCLHFELVAHLATRHAFLVGTRYYEGGEYLMIDDRTGKSMVIPSIPHFGPGGRDFITIENDESYGDFAVKIWRRERDEAVLVWRHGNDADPVYHMTDLVRWDGPNRILLDLRSGHDPEVHWPGTLIKDKDGWRLEAQWPAR